MSEIERQRQMIIKKTKNSERFTPKEISQCNKLVSDIKAELQTRAINGEAIDKNEALEIFALFFEILFVEIYSVNFQKMLKHIWFDDIESQNECALIVGKSGKRKAADFVPDIRTYFEGNVDSVVNYYNTIKNSHFASKTVMNKMMADYIYSKDLENAVMPEFTVFHSWKQVIKNMIIQYLSDEFFDIMFHTRDNGFYCIKDISNNIKHIGEKYKRTTTQRIDAMLFILYFYHMKTIITEYCAEFKDFT